MDGSRGVDGVLVVAISPVASSTATTSVNVPPVSIPILSRRGPRRPPPRPPPAIDGANAARARTTAGSVTRRLRRERGERLLEAGQRRLHQSRADLCSEGASTAPSEASPRNRWRGRSPRSNHRGVSHAAPPPRARRAPARSRPAAASPVPRRPLLGGGLDGPLRGLPPQSMAQAQPAL